MLERYTGAFLEALAARALKEAGFRVVIDYAWGNASIVLPQVLGGLGVDQISLNAYFDAQRVRTFRHDRERHLEQLGAVVKSLEANLGLLIDADGETFTLVDDRGRIVGRNRLFALLTLLIARATPGRASRCRSPYRTRSNRSPRNTARRSCARAATGVR